MKSLRLPGRVAKIMFPGWPSASLRRLWFVGTILAGLLGWSHAVYAQAPGLLWRTNIDATLFAVDGQTNLYANAGGSVITLSGSGIPIQTNAVCPLAGVAQRDAAGDYLFAGNFDGTQNFGGITLVGGWTNWPSSGDWSPGWPTCFLAKYGSAGNLLWVISFGHQSYVNRVHDMAVSADGSVLIGYDYSGIPALARFSSTGSNVWEDSLSSQAGSCRALNVGQFNGNTGSFLLLDSGTVHEGTCDASGNLTWLLGYPPVLWASLFSTNGRPAVNVTGEGYLAGLSPSTGTPLLEKLNSANILWTQAIGTVEQCLVAQDAGENLYLSASNGLISKYDPNGTLIWSNQLDSPVCSMLVDSAGNRFVNLADGSVARMGAEALPQSPAVTRNPDSQTVFVGSNVTLSATADGTPPLQYQWQFNGTNLPEATNTTLNLTNVIASETGGYSLEVANAAGAVTSAPAMLRVKSVELYSGDMLLTNGVYVFSSPPTLTIRSAFANGSSFYTLDGSSPDFSSVYYSTPFVLSQSATVRAIGYSADFKQSEEADTIQAVVLVGHTLTAGSSGGGSVTLDPPGGVYVGANVVTATAVAKAGWTFLYWLGDASGNDSIVTVSMERDKSIFAVFGTTLSTTVAGNGGIQLNPPGGVYAYGATVRVTAIPQAGSYFGFWGNAATGAANPLYFTITNANPTISSIFGTNSATQAALTVLISGNGRVSMNPTGNVFSTSQTVEVTAMPDAGATFMNWSGDATGSRPSVGLSMAQSRTVTANFSGSPVLQLNRANGDGSGPDGFRFTLTGDPGSIYEIFASTDLFSWQSLGFVTNTYGVAQVTDGGATNQSRRFYKAVP